MKRGLFGWLLQIETVLILTLCSKKSMQLLQKDRYIWPSILPVLHNVEDQHIHRISELLHERTSISLSLRSPSSISSLYSICRVMNPNQIGASTVVSEEQINRIKESGASFISTMFTCNALFTKAKENGNKIYSCSKHL